MSQPVKSTTDDSGKARITITLRNSLLPQLDRFIDGQHIRNRSHAIEYILGQHLGLGIEQAVLFCGADSSGRVITLTPIEGEPIISHWLKALKAVGVQHVILVIDRHGDALKDYVAKGQQWGITVTTVRDHEASGTAHALSLVQPLLEKTFLLIYSDMLADINFTDMAEHHRQSGTVGTMALTYKRHTDPYGVARMEGMKIVDFTEKLGAAGQHGLVNAGIYFFEPSVFDLITPLTKSLERDVLPQLARTGQLAGYPFQSRWVDVSRAIDQTTAEPD